MRKMFIKKIAIYVLLFFSWSILTNGVNFADNGDKDPIAKSEQLFKDMQYDEAIKTLDNFIEIYKLKDGNTPNITYKMRLAKAFSLLARIYFSISEIDHKEKIQKNIKNSLKYNINYKAKTVNKDFVELYNKIKKEYISQNPQTKPVNKKVVIKIGKKKKKKNFPVLLVLVGVAAVVAAVVLLGGKKESTLSPTPTNNYAQEVYDSLQWQSVPAGNFQMGSYAHSDESPIHTVSLDSYYISKYEVTFEQYDMFCDDTGRGKPSDEGWGRGNRPVINVSWSDAKAFCDWITSKTGNIVSLPTEAQWEKAARGTDQLYYPWGNGSPNSSLCNYLNYVGKTQPVGSYSSGVSPYGVHDMAGNVWEWCSDWYGSSYYSSSPTNNPTGPTSGASRVIRGGGWQDYASDIRSANRATTYPTTSNERFGIRIVKNN